MNSVTISILNQIEKARKLPGRATRKVLKIPAITQNLEIDCSGKEANDLILKRMMDDSPLMIARIGRVEREAIIRHENIISPANNGVKLANYLFQGSGPFWWDDKFRHAIQNNAGFFPPSDEALSMFVDRLEEELGFVDILGVFGDENNLRHHFLNSIVVPLADLEPYYHGDPWSQALENKRVLVIHPFDQTIRNQYHRRSLLFKDPLVLPKFELITLRAVQSIAQNPVRFSTWFEALDWMAEEMGKMHFDVAIIGAGAYGLPLSAMAKRMGKKAINLAGATQILFGIRGKRWDQIPFFQTLYNEFWIRPLPEETPQNFQAVEDGCYW
jgi:hypothetical protein